MDVYKIPELKSNFNPRSRVGSDETVTLVTLGVADFNPRSRVGSDNIELAGNKYPLISIRAPAWGATLDA